MDALLKMYLPNVPPITGGNVIVPNEIWNQLLSYIDTMRGCINAQADIIVELRKDLNTANSQIVVLAESLEGLYDENE